MALRINVISGVILLLIALAAWHVDAQARRWVAVVKETESAK